MEALRRLFIIQPQRGGRDRSQDFVLGEILEEVRKLRKEVKKMQAAVAAALAALQTEVAENTAADQAAITLLQGLKTQLDDALNSSEDPSEVIAQIKALSDQLSADTDQLAAAVTANTPAAPDGDAPQDPPADNGGGDGEATDPTA